MDNNDKTIGIFSEEASSTVKNQSNHKKKQLGAEIKKVKKENKTIEENEIIENIAFSSQKELSEDDILVEKQIMKEERRFKPKWLLIGLILSITIIGVLELLALATIGHGSTSREGTILLFIDIYVSFVIANFIGDKGKWNTVLRIVASIVLFVIIVILTELIIKKIS